MNKAIFLDRDGTINVEKDYIYKCEDLVFEEGSVEVDLLVALLSFREHCHLVVSVNNAEENLVR